MAHCVCSFFKYSFIVLALLLGYCNLSMSAKIPDFTAVHSIQARKLLFISYLVPMAERINTQILQQRQQLYRLYVRHKNHNTRSRRQRHWVARLAESYGIDDFNPQRDNDWTQLLARVDEVPTSIILAQAANESAWGSSRFATQANNYFGQWCYRPGCGLVPLHRNSGASHEVRRFSDPVESMRAYIHNLNTNASYQAFRQIRVRSRVNDQPLRSKELVKGLSRYSQLGRKYVPIIQAIIRHNDFERFDGSSP